MWRIKKKAYTKEAKNKKGIEKKLIYGPKKHADAVYMYEICIANARVHYKIKNKVKIEGRKHKPKKKLEKLVWLLETGIRLCTCMWHVMQCTCI